MAIGRPSSDSQSLLNCISHALQVQDIGKSATETAGIGASAMDRYICLPEYKCRCIETAPGKAVSRSTMNNHRSAANKKRSRQGMEALPVGVKYTRTESERVRALATGNGRHLRTRCEAVHPENSDDVLPTEPKDRSQRRDQQVNLSAQMPSSHLEQEHDEACPNEISQPSNVPDEEDLGSPPTVQYDSVPREAREAAVVAGNVVLGDSKHYAMVRSLLDESEHDSDDDITGEEAGAPDVFALHEDDNDSSAAAVQLAVPRDRFLEWAHDNRRWVDLALKFGTTHAIMREVLDILDAWVTVFRNIIKYSGIETISYLSCESHMLFSDCVITERNPMPSVKPRCDICEQEGSTPRYVKFEYIPLAPRIQSWVGRSSTFEALFEYRTENCDLEGDGSSGYPATFSDYFDGSLYKDLVAKNGGEEDCAFDVFIAPSTDGFDVYCNGRYDCWSIAALNLNLSPNVRFLMRNIIPFGFVGGSSQPVNLESFLVPLLKELRTVNANGGMYVDLPDGSRPLLRVHVMWVTADLQAYPKFSGHLGPSAKKPCLCCDVPSFYLHESRRYYLPSRIKQLSERRSNGVELVTIYNPSSPRDRIPVETDAIMSKLDANSGVLDLMKARIRKETGVRGRALLHAIPSIIPLESFPIDTMHHGYNISKDIMEILKGENSHLLRLSDYHEEPFVLSRSSWKMIDNELRQVAATTSHCAFGASPRDTTVYKQRKASEYRQFVLNYWLVLLDGHIPRSTMSGFVHWTKIMDLWSRPTLSANDVDEIGALAVQFFTYFEREYFKYDRRRVGLCKLTLHMVLHLRSTIDRCGPPVGYSQFWMERYVGFTKSRLNARNRAAESMTQNALFLEVYKLFYNEPFVTSSEESGSGSLGVVETSSDGGLTYRKVILLSPMKRQQLSSRENMRLRIRELLALYIKATESLTESAANEAVGDETFYSFGGAKVGCGDGFKIIGALLHGRKRRRESRGNWFIAAEYLSASTGSKEQHDIYYGRVLMFLQYSFRVGGNVIVRDLVLADWASRLKVTEHGQVYSDATADQSFSSPTVGDISAIMNSIGILEHHYPAGDNHSPRRGKKTFFLDPQRTANELLRHDQPAPDGVYRNLACLTRGVGSRNTR